RYPLALGLTPVQVGTSCPQTKRYVAPVVRTVPGVVTILTFVYNPVAGSNVNVPLAVPPSLYVPWTWYVVGAAFATTHNKAKTPNIGQNSFDILGLQVSVTSKLQAEQLSF